MSRKSVNTAKRIDLLQLFHKHLLSALNMSNIKE